MGVWCDRRVILCHLGGGVKVELKGNWTGGREAGVF